ncbi:glycine cleavage system protein H [PVC group bacterium (ex Bugula neritina AB1)]|nr:glycine cleavage system protein H [PVC group bacterium (ex Bugula neritina AB1)]
MTKVILNETYFTKDHEWVFPIEDKALVGISDYAQKNLGDVVFVELPTEGQTFAQHEACCVLESVKAASEVFIPLSGTIASVNLSLEDDPGQINSEPYAKGFLFTIRDFDKEELKSLMSFKEYENFIKEEG